MQLCRRTNISDTQWKDTRVTESRPSLDLLPRGRLGADVMNSTETEPLTVQNLVITFTVDVRLVCSSDRCLKPSSTRCLHMAARLGLALLVDAYNTWDELAWNLTAA